MLSSIATVYYGHMLPIYLQLLKLIPTDEDWRFGSLWMNLAWVAAALAPESVSSPFTFAQRCAQTEAQVVGRVLAYLTYIWTQKECKRP